LSSVSFSDFSSSEVESSPSVSLDLRSRTFSEQSVTLSDENASHSVSCESFRNNSSVVPADCLLLISLSVNNASIGSSVISSDDSSTRESTSPCASGELLYSSPVNGAILSLSRVSSDDLSTSDVEELISSSSSSSSSSYLFTSSNCMGTFSSNEAHLGSSSESLEDLDGSSIVDFPDVFSFIDDESVLSSVISLDDSGASHSSTPIAFDVFVLSSGELNALLSLSVEFSSSFSSSEVESSPSHP